MAVIAEWRDIDELGPPAGAGKGCVHSAHQFGPEELVVLRVDPQRRNPRRLAERGEGANQRILVADVIVGARTAATGEVDRGGEPRRRIGGQRNDAKPPAETPTAIMPLVETSVQLPMASTAARRSLADCQAERKYSRWPHGPLLSAYWPPESP
jgi:hypothetical protein